jgi:hypothetical protein
MRQHNMYLFHVGSGVERCADSAESAHLYNVTHVRIFGYVLSVRPLMYVHLDMPLYNVTHVLIFGYVLSVRTLMNVHLNMPPL